MPAAVAHRWFSGAFICAAVGVGYALVAWQVPATVSRDLLVTEEVCVVAPLTPFDPAWGIGLHVARPVPLDARCPVCGMFPAKSREWAAQVIFQDGATQFFDSPLSLFIYLQDVGRYTAGRQSSDIAADFVSDSANGGWIPAQHASYVSGSNALGPMRAGNLPAFSNPEAAGQFAAERGGKVLAADQISKPLLEALSGKKRHSHVEGAV
jgi:copper chaperone NosL